MMGSCHAMLYHALQCRPARPGPALTHQVLRPNLAHCPTLVVSSAHWLTASQLTCRVMGVVIHCVCVVRQGMSVVC